VKGDLVLKEENIYMPKDEKLRIEIIWLYNDVLAAEYKER